MNMLCVIVLCGGRGTRLWPLSRATRPKYLIDLGERGSLLAMTLHRACSIADPDRIVVVCSEQHAAETLTVAKSFGIDWLVTEPSPRDTTAAVLLGIRSIERRFGPSRVVSLPADHEVDDNDAWAAAIRTATTTPDDHVATIGIEPTVPSVEYGYIEVASRGAPHLPVVRFHEKPNLAHARTYLASGQFLWNTAMMSFTTAGIRAGLLIEAGDVVHAVDAAGAPGALDPARWKGVRSVALEHSLMEPAAVAGLVDVVPAQFGWRDLGIWTELAGMLSLSKRVISTQPGARVIAMPGAGVRRYVNAGVPGLIVVDTGDVVLITTDHAASEVKAAVKLAEEAGWEDVL